MCGVEPVSQSENSRIGRGHKNSIKRHATASTAPKENRRAIRFAAMRAVRWQLSIGASDNYNWIKREEKKEKRNEANSIDMQRHESQRSASFYSTTAKRAAKKWI